MDEKAEEWGRESPIFQVRCGGNFPEQGERAVVALAAVEAARERFDAREGPATDPLEVGVDPARFGDDETIVTVRRGYSAKQQPVPNGDGHDTAGCVLELVHNARRGKEPARIKVDVIGVGASVYDALRRTAPEGVEVVAVNVAERALDEERYAKLRDQLWFGLRDWIRDGGELPDDGKLEAELLAPEYSFDARGRYVVESKDVTKAKLGRSPDRADSLALSVFSPPAAPPREPSRGADDVTESDRWGNAAGRGW